MGTVKRTVGLRFGEGNEWAILCVALWRLAVLFCICQSLRNGQDQDCDSGWYWCITIGDSKKKKMYISGPGCQRTRLCTHGDRSMAGNSTMSKNRSKNETKRPQKAETIKQKWGRSKLTLKWRSGFEKVWIELLQMTIPISEMENKYQKHYISISMAKLKKMDNLKCWQR